MKEEYTLYNVKEYLKKLGTKISIKKQMCKTVYRDLSRFTPGLVSEVYSERRRLGNYQNEFRHLHVAYCEFRGRTREQVERKTENPPNEDLIKDLKFKIKIAMEKHHEERKKTICIGA